jgi:hypothetical protein
MEARNNGFRFKDYKKWENVDKKNLNYDYANDGLLQHIMSPIIVQTSNPVLKYILNYLENSLIFLLQYTDILKNFKNPHWKNR